jgi:hypothetical protein
LELPIIQGLKAYSPQEEFFDPTLLKRIENAQPKPSENTKLNKEKPKNKAARTLPNKFKRNRKQLKKPLK